MGEREQRERAVGTVVARARAPLARRRSGRGTQMPPPQPQSAPRARLRWQVRSLAVAALVLVVINVLLQLDRRYWDVRSDTVGGLRKVEACESLGRKPDVLYLGSSRTLYAVDPMLVDQTVREQTGQSILSCNAAVSGTDFEQDYYTLKRFIEDGYVPKVVVETLWELNLNVSAALPIDNRVINSLQVVNLADAKDTPNILHNFGSGHRYQATAALLYLLGKAVPLYGDRVGIFRALCSYVTIGPCTIDTSQLDATTQHYLDVSIQERGWVPLTNSLAQINPTTYLTKTSAAYQLFHPETQNFKIGGPEPGYLAQLIALAKAHGIKLVLVQTPVSPTYFYFFDRGEADWTTIMAYWTTFAQQHAVAFYDESLAPGYTAADFDDPHHLNAYGARMFSTWLATQVVGPLVR